jgi:hypothetical protein
MLDRMQHPTNPALPSQEPGSQARKSGPGSLVPTLHPQLAEPPGDEYDARRRPAAAAPPRWRVTCAKWGLPMHRLFRFSVAAVLKRVFGCGGGGAQCK